jgi:hypothetical protein
MESFLRGKDVSSELDIMIDHRYLDEVECRGQVVCGITHETLAMLVRQNSPRQPLQWVFTTVSQSKKNSSVLEFSVEQECIAYIASHGFKTGGKVVIPPIRTTPLVGNVVALQETTRKQHFTCRPIPLVWRSIASIFLLMSRRVPQILYLSRSPPPTSTRIQRGTSTRTLGHRC